MKISNSSGQYYLKAAVLGLSLCLVGAGAPALKAETIYIGGQPGTEAPYEVGEPIGGPSGGASVQWLLLSDEITPLGNNYITGMAFRLDQSYDPALPAFGYQNLKITLGFTSLTNFDEDTDMSANIDNSQNSIVVFDGSFFYAANSFESGNSPNAFGSFIKFETPFLNDTSKNLIFTIQHTRPINENGTALTGVSYFSADAGDAGREVLVGDYEMDGSRNWFATPVSAFTTDSLPDNYDAVPEPATNALLGLGLIAGLWGWRKHSRKQGEFVSC